MGGCALDWWLARVAWQTGTCSVDRLPDLALLLLTTEGLAWPG